MSTDFNTNNIQIKGSLRPKIANTPLDIRTVVETEADILSIPMPYVGMVVYVKDTGKLFEVLTIFTFSSLIGLLPYIIVVFLL